MKTIQEKESYFGTIYEVYIEEILIKTIRITRISKKYDDGNRYIFLLDSDGKVIKDVFNFLNDHCKRESVNGREQAASALKLLYVFAEIIEKELRDFNDTDIINLSSFLLGETIEGNIKRLVLNTNRSISTQNQYLDNIRKYFKFIGVQNAKLFEKVTVMTMKSGYGMMSHTKTVHISKYKTNRTRHKSLSTFVPKYIEYDEYERIIEHIKNRNTRHDTRDRLIIDLMYTKGLRIGEVLGLTLEDIQTHPEDSTFGVIYLRNRLSDNKDQNAKTCMKVFSKMDCESSLYREKNVGYQEIILPPILMGKVQEYINASRDVFNITDKRIRNIMSYAKADSVVNKERDNFYLFLNKNGSRLTATGFSKQLKKVFTQLDIPIDVETKKNNLNHKFRHGYAMYLVEVLKKDINFVKEEMRHRSILSTMKYYNPKPKTILKQAKELQDIMLNTYKIY